MIGKTWRSVSWVKYVCQKNRRIQKPTEACLNLRQRMSLSLNLQVSLSESCITRIPERSERPHSYLVHHLLHILLSFFRGWFNVKLAVYHACAFCLMLGQQYRSEGSWWNWQESKMAVFKYQISWLGGPLVDILVHIDLIFWFLNSDNLYFAIIWLFLFFSVVAVLLVVTVGIPQ